MATYNIQSYLVGTGANFNINSSGILTTTAELDREINSSYLIQIQIVTGSPVQTFTSNVTVVVLDINDNDPSFLNDTLKGYTTENAAVGTVIMQLGAIDLDSFNATITYSIPSTGNSEANTHLYIDSSTGEISVSTSIDRETVGNSFTFNVVALENGTTPRSATATATIYVADQNDNNPVLSSTFYNSAMPYMDTSSCSDGVIATLSATDADRWSNARLSYYLVQSDDSYLFQMNTTTGDHEADRHKNLN